MFEIISMKGAYRVEDLLYIKNEDYIESPFTAKKIYCGNKLISTAIKEDIEANKGKEMLPLWYNYFETRQYGFTRNYYHFRENISKLANYGYSNTLIKVQDVL